MKARLGFSVFFVVFVLAVSNGGYLHAQETAAQIREFEQRVLVLTNAERAKFRLPPLLWHEVLASAARAHSEDMLRNNMTGHTGSDGSSPRQRVDRKGVTGATSWSENVAYGSPTPEAVVQAWMDSPGHRANILNDKSTHMGAGLLLRPAGSKATYSHYWTQKFIRLPAGTPAVTSDAPVNQQQPAPAAVQAPVPAPVTVAAAPAPAVVAAPIMAAESDGRFTAIPNPVVRTSTRTAMLYWQGRSLTSTVLPVYDSSDKRVSGVRINDGATAGSSGAKRRVGVWDLKDLDGRPLPAGRYTVRGVLNTSGGESVQAGLVIDVR